MKDFVLSDNYRVLSAEGSQEKYYKDGVWYKQDLMANEGQVEQLASLVLSYSNLPSSVYVKYKLCTINGNMGCYSKDFSENGRYSFFTLANMMRYEYGANWKSKFSSLSVSERKTEILEISSRQFSLDLSDYFAKIFSLDLLMLNIDRHLNNLGVFFDNQTNSYKEAVIFDNGLSLTNGYISMKQDESMMEKVRNLKAKPFSPNFEQQMKLFGVGFKLDVVGLYVKLSQISQDVSQDKRFCSQVQLLKRNLKRYMEYFYSIDAYALITADNEYVGMRIVSLGSTYDTTYHGIPLENTDGTIRVTKGSDGRFYSQDELMSDCTVKSIDKNLVAELFM